MMSTTDTNGKTIEQARKDAQATATVQEVTPTVLLALARKWVPSSDATQAQKTAMNAVVTALYHAVNA